MEHEPKLATARVLVGKPGVTESITSVCYALRRECNHALVQLWVETLKVMTVRDEGKEVLAAVAPRSRLVMDHRGLQL